MRTKRILAVVAGLLVAGVVASVGALFFVLRHYSEGLPSVERLKAGYDPPQISRIFAADDTLLSSMFTERRTVIPFSKIPDAAKLAFLAAEDARFYEHEGLNYLGVLRALWVNVRAGRTVQGGSTITQQVVKNVLLDQERTMRRKVREIILTGRLEQSLTKDEIFNLYLNHIFLGHGRYGIEEASQYYFGTPAAEIDAAQAALLAGLVAAPERFTPRRYKDRALGRRKYVLEQMRAKGFITPEYFDKLSTAPLNLAPEPDSQSALAPEAVAVAKETLTRVQKERQSHGGFSIKTTIRPELQLGARRAVRKALSEYADRHKLWPPYESKKIKAWGKPFEGQPAPNRVYVGVVESTDDAQGKVVVRVGGVIGHVLLADEERYNPKRLPASQFAKPGALLRVRLADGGDREQPRRLHLELGPQAALVAIDVASRDIVALVGSQEALPGMLDRARQARRQPGSAFKPIVFSLALRDRNVTAATMLDLKATGNGVIGTPDPEAPALGVAGKPPFKISVRNALAFSNNEAAVQLLQTNGAQQVVDFAHELGIESKLGADLSLALGSYEVTPLELCNVFATFASGGFYEQPRLLAELRAPGGELLPLPERAPRRRVLEPDVAYLTSSLLESVVKVGTGRKALRLGHPVAGKTGTTNEVKDAWFVGYSTELSVAVWVGYDDALPLGEVESGSRTALPAFVDFMTSALEGRPHLDFPRPPNIVVAAVDPETGLLPWPGHPNPIDEEFLDGTVPTQTAPEPMPDTGEEMPYKPEPSETD